MTHVSQSECPTYLTMVIGPKYRHMTQDIPSEYISYMAEVISLGLAK